MVDTEDPQKQADAALALLSAQQARFRSAPQKAMIVQLVAAIRYIQATTNGSNPDSLAPLYCLAHALVDSQNGHPSRLLTKWPKPKSKATYPRHDLYIRAFAAAAMREAMARGASRDGASKLVVEAMRANKLRFYRSRRRGGYEGQVADWYDTFAGRVPPPSSEIENRDAWDRCKQITVPGTDNLTPKQAVTEIISAIAKAVPILDSD